MSIETRFGQTASRETFLMSKNAASGDRMQLTASGVVYDLPTIDIYMSGV